jgi:hypothetical protein
MKYNYKELQILFLRYKKASLNIKHKVNDSNIDRDVGLVEFINDCLAMLDKDSRDIILGLFVNNKTRHDMPYCTASFYKKLNKAMSSLIELVR